MAINTNFWKNKNVFVTGHNGFKGNNETHIKIILTKKDRTSSNRLNIHRIINTLLEEEFKNGLHSLEIKIN